MSQTKQGRNKALVLEAFDTLFNKRDYAAAERYWSPAYVQHSAHIPPGREGLFELVRNLPPTLRYENVLTIAEGEFVMLHGRFSGIGQPAPGSSWMSCALQTAAWPSTGTSSRTRPPR